MIVVKQSLKRIVADLSSTGKSCRILFPRSSTTGSEARAGRQDAGRLNTRWFLSLGDACGELDRWHRHYNEKRPHSANREYRSIMLVKSANGTSPPDMSRRKTRDRAAQGWVAVQDYYAGISGSLGRSLGYLYFIR